MAKADVLAARFVVLHDMVDRYHKGQAITLDHLKAGLPRDIDLDRLLRLGALAPEASAAAHAVRAELGPDALTRDGDPVTADVPLPPLDVTHPDHPSYPPQS